MKISEQIIIDANMIIIWLVENNIKVNEINKIANYFYKNTTYQFQHTIQYFNKVHKKIIDHDKFQRDTKPSWTAKE
jgi:hypothetical protein